MNVLCIGYYDKFSRLFLHIEKHLKNKFPTINFTVDSMYLSGFLYTLIRRKKGSWLSLKAWRLAKRNKKKYNHLLASSHLYKSFDLNKLINRVFNAKYHKKEELLRQAMAYIDILEQKLIGIDILLLIGDSRLPFEIATQLAKNLDIKIFYIEQGPFQTTILDTKGVNANLSVRGYQTKETITEKQKQQAYTTLTRKKNKKYFRNPIYRGLDYIIELFIKNTPLYPADLKIDFSVLNKQKAEIKFKQFKKNEHLGKNIFLFACQVPFDVNITHHSPYFKTHVEILKEIYCNLPPNSILLVREHPIYKNQYGEEFYSIIRENQGVFLDNTFSLNQILNLSNVIIVVNSTVGLEAITQYKPVLVLGNAYYDSSGICVKYSSDNSMQNFLMDTLNYTPNKSAVLNFINHLQKQSLLTGFITEKNTSISTNIAKKIISEYEKK